MPDLRAIASRIFTSISLFILGANHQIWRSNSHAFWNTPVYKGRKVHMHTPFAKIFFKECLGKPQGPNSLSPVLACTGVLWMTGSRNILSSWSKLAVFKRCITSTQYGGKYSLSIYSIASNWIPHFILIVELATFILWDELPYFIFNYFSKDKAFTLSSFLKL